MKHDGGIMQNINSRVKKHRDSLRERGLRPVQFWVPDTGIPGFAEECKRQSSLVTQVESDSGDLDYLDEIEGWED